MSLSSSASNTSSPAAIWYTRCPVPTPLGIAVQLGFFHDEFSPDGLELLSLQETRNPAEQASHFDHSLPYSFRQGGNIPPIWARSKGRDTRVIGLSWTDEFQGVIALPEKGLKSARDLRGLRVGLPKRDIAIDFTRAAALKGVLTALELEGMGHSEVEFVDLPDQPIEDYLGALGDKPRQAVREYTNEVRALVRGQVDAIFVKGVAGLETAHQIGATVISETGHHPDPQVRIGNGTPRTLTVDGGLLETHPDIVARFLARTVDAGRWAAAHAAQTQSYVGRETHSTSDWVRYAYGENVHEHLQTNLEEASIKGLRSFKDFLFKWGFIPQDFDSDAWISHAPLEHSRRYTKL